MSDIEPMPSEDVRRGPGRPPKVPIMEPPKVTMIPVKLLKHHSPRGAYEIIELGRPPVPGAPPLPEYLTKDRRGNILEKRTKLWAGTVVRLPRDEVVALLENQVERIENVIGDDGKVIPGRKHTVRIKMPLAERADALPV